VVPDAIWASVSANSPGDRCGAVERRLFRSDAMGEIITSVPRIARHSPRASRGQRQQGFRMNEASCHGPLRGSATTDEST
jgi:hypothetical protein